MAHRYGMLPSEVLERGSTFDLQIYQNSGILKERETKKARGESINDTYTPEQITEMYDKFKRK